MRCVSLISFTSQAFFLASFHFSFFQLKQGHPRLANSLESLTPTLAPFSSILSNFEDNERYIWYDTTEKLPLVFA